MCTLGFFRLRLNVTFAFVPPQFAFILLHMEGQLTLYHVLKWLWSSTIHSLSVWFLRRLTLASKMKILKNSKSVRLLPNSSQFKAQFTSSTFLNMGILPSFEGNLWQFKISKYFNMGHVGIFSAQIKCFISDSPTSFRFYPTPYGGQLALYHILKWLESATIHSLPASVLRRLTLASRNDILKNSKCGTLLPNSNQFKAQFTSCKFLNIGILLFFQWNIWQFQISE